MTALRFRLTDVPLSAALISQLRKLAALSIAEIRNRVTIGAPLIELKAFSKTWHEDRTKLLEIARRIESGELPLSVTEVFSDQSEVSVSSTMLRNLISHFREIELQTQADTMLELGEIDDPSQFEPYDDDWTR